MVVAILRLCCWSKAASTIANDNMSEESTSSSEQVFGDDPPSTASPTTSLHADNDARTTAEEPPPRDKQEGTDEEEKQPEDPNATDETVPEQDSTRSPQTSSIIRSMSVDSPPKAAKLGHSSMRITSSATEQETPVQASASEVSHKNETYGTETLDVGDAQESGEEMETMAETDDKTAEEAEQAKCAAEAAAFRPFRTQFKRISTAVTMLDVESNRPIRVFFSLRQAEREMKVHRKHLRAALDSQPDGQPGIADGYRWRLYQPGDDEHIAARVAKKPTKVKPAPQPKKAPWSRAPQGTSDEDGERRVVAQEAVLDGASKPLSNDKKSGPRKRTTSSELTGNFAGNLASPADMELVGAETELHENVEDAYAKKRRRNSESSYSGSESSSEEGEYEGVGVQNELPALKQGKLEFTLNGALQSQLICELCMGYFREPYRITTCLQ